VTSSSDRLGRFPDPVTGLGPHGEFAASVDQLGVSGSDVERARQRGFSVAVVLHTTTSDWSRQQIAGIGDTLQAYGATLTEVIDCEFSTDRQIDALTDLTTRRPDAVISIPVHNVQTADAHRLVGEAGIKLVLMDNAPIGLIARKHYVTVVSADNFGNGQIGAQLLSPFIPASGVVGIVGFGVDFFVTNEREIAFRKWLADHRPDVRIRQGEFVEPHAAGDVVASLSSDAPAVAGIFVAWDVPAMHVVAAMQALGQSVPMTTVDLGLEAATELARGGVIKGIAAQRPYDLGVAEATAAIMSLLGDEPPPWVVLPGFPVTRDNVLAAYESVWHADAPDALRREIAVQGGAPAHKAENPH
jgi:ribose transport system substrate-binding protein